MIPSLHAKQTFSANKLFMFLDRIDPLDFWSQKKWGLAVDMNHDGKA